MHLRDKLLCNPILKAQERCRVVNDLVKAAKGIRRSHFIWWRFYFSFSQNKTKVYMVVVYNRPSSMESRAQVWWAEGRAQVCGAGGRDALRFWGQVGCAQVLGTGGICLGIGGR